MEDEHRARGGVQQPTATQHHFDGIPFGGDLTLMKNAMSSHQQQHPYGNATSKPREISASASSVSLIIMNIHYYLKCLY
jgi:hypothetical protein